MSRGWGSRRGEGEGGSRGSPGVFFFHRGSTIDPLNFSLLLAPPTPTAISHFSFFLSLSIPLWFSFLFVSAFPPFLASVAIMSCALPNFFTSPLLSSLLSLSPLFFVTFVRYFYPPSYISIVDGMFPLLPAEGVSMVD